MIVKVDTVVFSVHTHPVHATLCVGGNSECVCECMCVCECEFKCVCVHVCECV